MPDEKVFQPYEQQVQILRTRGLLVADDAAAIAILERENYYNLINGYKPLFLLPGSPETYKPGATFEEIYALAQFDRRLRILFLDGILQVENYVKSVVAYEFSRCYGHRDFLKAENFECQAGRLDRRSEVQRLLEKTEGTINEYRSKHNAIQHYFTQHGYVPLWVLVNVMTFAHLTTFYSLLQQPERQRVAKRFNLWENSLRAFLAPLVLFRNRCAHDELLYDYRVRHGIPDTPLHAALGMAKNRSGMYRQGKQDLFAVLLTLKIFLPAEDFHRIVLGLQAAFASLEVVVQTIDLATVRWKMGFPANWQEIVLLMPGNKPI